VNLGKSGIQAGGHTHTHTHSSGSVHNKEGREQETQREKGRRKLESGEREIQGRERKSS